VHRYICFFDRSDWKQAVLFAIIEQHRFGARQTDSIRIIHVVQYTCVCMLKSYCLSFVAFAP
jgi:hypothetical protein